MDNGSYLRITGWLREDGVFMPDQGWQTPRISHPVRGCKDHRLELLDSDGNVLDSTCPQVDFDDCQSSGGHMKSKQVVGYLPWHALGAAIRLTRYGRMLYTRTLAESTPIIQWKRVHIEAGQLILSWSVRHSEPVTCNVAILNGARRAVPLVYKTPETTATIPIATIPFGGACRAVVLATDGIRSSQSRSDEFVLPEKPPRVVLLQPAAGQELSEADGFSLSGFAIDPLGRSLPDEPLLWRLDGREIARGTRLHWVDPLPVGSHSIELTWGHEQHASDRVVVTVRRRTDAEQRWANDVRRAQAELESGRAGSRRE